jgi:cysteine-S-conjugate beta-lyase
MLNEDSPETKLVHLGSRSEKQHGFVNPPLYRGSTFLYESVRQMKESTTDPLRRTPRAYGRFGTPTCRAFEAAMTELEQGYDAICTSSGLSSITTAIMALVETGDHILVSDSVYKPTRAFCESLRRLGVETEYYDPTIGKDIEQKLRVKTRFVFMESPGSNTFEIQDVPAITAVCRARQTLTLVDNTWATPLFFRPLTLGADIVIHSATKYVIGHSDGFLGVIVCNEKTYAPVRMSAVRLGQCAGPDDIYFGLRGLKTLATRMRQHESQALLLAQWLQDRPEVAEVFHPALPQHAGHRIWKRDFTGSSGLFSILLQPRYEEPAVQAMLDSLRLFGLGHGWGGFESLIVPVESIRPGSLLRIHVGLENLGDLKADLVEGFKTLRCHSPFGPKRYGSSEPGIA